MNGSSTDARVGGEITVAGLTKRFGPVTAVDDLSFTVRPGRVTGFLGPNGAGKTTTLRCLLGLVSPTSGSATIGARRYTELADPLHQVGAALEATGFHVGRSARDHLRVLAATAAISDARVDEVLAMVGLSQDARRRTGGYSLGMRQRLALAAAMLGDPPVLIFDEPANGLDPEGIRWLRELLRHLAQQGRTVLLSSHVLSEVQQTVDDVVIVARGKLVSAGPLAELEGRSATVVRTPTRERLRQVLADAGLRAVPVPGEPDGALRVPDAGPESVGRLAHAGGVELHELRLEASDLEATFLALTRTAEATT
jgi:ABC-2 type transport system ATP-binding protein